MLGSRRGTLVLLPPRVRRRLALCGDHADARASRTPAQRRNGLEVYARAATGAARVGGAMARSLFGLASRSRAEAAAALGEAGAGAAERLSAGGRGHLACDALFTPASRSPRLPPSPLAPR